MAVLDLLPFTPAALSGCDRSHVWPVIGSPWLTRGSPGTLGPWFGHGDPQDLAMSRC
jgi:hypothetical protein